MTDAQQPAAVTFEALVIETLWRICDHLYTTEVDLEKLLGVEMPAAPRFEIPKSITSATATRAMMIATDAARAFVSASRADQHGGNFREVERDATGRVAAVIDPVAGIRRRAQRDPDGRVVGFTDEYIGGGS